MIKAAIIYQDKDYLQLEQCCSQLYKNGEINLFSDPWEALLFFTDEFKVDIVIIDVDIVACDDLKLVKLISALFPKMMIAFTSESERYALEGFRYHIVNYFLKPYTEVKLRETLDKAKHLKQLNKEKEIFVRMFGSFEISIDGKPIRWNNSKSKELFCLLIDARGMPVSSEKLQGILWPNSDDTRAATSLHTALHQLRKILENNEIGEILECGRGRQRVKIELFCCDSYEFERCMDKGNKKAYLKAFELYRGHYLENENFSWKYFNRIRFEMQFEELLTKI